MPKITSLECKYCDEPIEDGQRFVTVILGAINPWGDMPGEVAGASERVMFHRDHADELLVALDYLRYGMGGDSLEIIYRHADGRTELVTGDMQQEPGQIVWGLVNSTTNQSPKCPYHPDQIAMWVKQVGDHIGRLQSKGPRCALCKSVSLKYESDYQSSENQ